MSPRPLLAALPFLLAPALGAAELTPRLVKDVDVYPQPASSVPSSYVTVGGVTFFNASDGDRQSGLWRTDGTAGGTYHLAPTARYFAANDRSYFFFNQSGSELWVSGGTAATTTRLADWPATQSTGGPRCWVPSLGLLFFTAFDGAHGQELWRSDGTAGGTYLLEDLRPGPESSRPRDMAAFGGSLYFVADDVRGYPVLWKSDGTPQGTRPVSVPPSVVAPDSLLALGRSLYFMASAPRGGSTLWRSDGTARGTVPLAKLVLGSSSRSFWNFGVLGSRVLFLAEAPASGQQLWITDGTARGTKPLTHFANPQAFNGPGLIQLLPRAPVGNRLVFAADDGIHGSEVWATDGTSKGTSLLKDVCPGSCSGASYVAAVFGNYALFSGMTPARGVEPWVTDGTPGGTHLLRDFCQGSCGSFPVSFLPVGNRFF